MPSDVFRAGTSVASALLRCRHVAHGLAVADLKGTQLADECVVRIFEIRVSLKDLVNVVAIQELTPRGPCADRCVEGRDKGCLAEEVALLVAIVAALATACGDRVGISAQADIPWSI